MSKEAIHCPHDHFFYASFSRPQLAQEFFTQHLPANIQELTDLNTLKMSSERFVDKNLRLATTDVLFEVNFAETPGYLYILTEHQSKPKKMMAFDVLKYVVKIMDKDLKKQKNNKCLPIVYAMVFYNGKQVYNYSTDIFDLFGKNKDLAKQIIFQPFKLIDVNKIEDEDLRAYIWSGCMQFIMKHTYAREFLPYLKLWLSQFQDLRQLGGHDYIEEAIHYIFEVAEISNKEEFIDTLHEVALRGDRTMTLAEQYEARGKTEGKYEEKKTIAIKLMQEGSDIAFIAKITGLTPEEIQELH